MSVQKVMIILLAVIAALYLVTIVMSASHGSQQTDRPSAVSALKGLQGSHFLTLGGDATTNCATGPDPGEVRLWFGCAIAVKGRGFLSSPTRVAFDVHGSVTVRTAAQNEPQQTASANDGDCFGTAIDHGGGTLTFFPSPGTNITLLDHACPPSS
jgi:hypothetical protein